MKIELVDALTSAESSAMFGDCEDCVYLNTFYVETLVFRFEDGSTQTIETGYWLSGGNYVVLLKVNDYPRFAQWLRDNEVSEEIRNEDGTIEYLELVQVLCDYENEIATCEDNQG